MIILAAKALLAYLMGSVSGSMVMGRIRHVDIRQSGSGNAGGTNAFRTQGFRFALGVVLIDIGKGVLAAWLLPHLHLPMPGAEADAHAVMLACGLAAVVGHCYPVWYGFRGGKGAATAVGALLVIQPLVLLPMIATWLLVLVATGWVGLATILAALSLVPAIAWLDGAGMNLVFVVLLALFVVFTHRSNIARMMARTEHRFERIRIVNWFGGR
ncbi:MAG: glycerol-3-phosphate 1-O-acyltransferase PlsY [Lysobacterales bacterium]|jgi:glycerol-3-phosphate acyltransferase PlsY